MTDMTGFDAASESTIRVAPVPVETVAPIITDYFAFSSFVTFDFPDGIQWIKFKVMSEGDKAAFQRSTNRDIKLNQKTNDATLNLDVATERHELIKRSVVDWYMFAPNTHTRVMEQVPFSQSATNNPTGMNLERWLKLANPKLVEELEMKIRKANPWMQQDMSIEEIDKEIKNLQELRAEVEGRNAGN